MCPWTHGTMYAYVADRHHRYILSSYAGMPFELKKNGGKNFYLKFASVYRHCKKFFKIVPKLHSTFSYQYFVLVLRGQTTIFPPTLLFLFIAIHS